jgi:peptidoglycan/LPS O-acetylase OafA/YrhL
MTKAALSLPYYPALDGLRGVGIIAMLLYHLDVGLASGAFLSLSMFFTLSGFLIARLLILEHNRTGRLALGAFFERRFRRLMPAALVGLAGASVYTFFFARPDLVARQAGDILAALFYVPNWRFIATGQSYEAIFTTPSPVQHFWSLGVEEQFYIFFPLLVATVLARGSSRALTLSVVGMTVASTATMMLSRTPGAPLGHAYYGTDTRAAEILIGVLLAIWVSARPAEYVDENRRASRLLTAAGLAAMLTSLALWLTTSEHQLWFYRGGAPVYSLLIGVVILAAIRSGPVRSMLGARVFVYIGRISYGLYVYHWPIYLAFEPLEPVLGRAGLVAAKLGTTFVVAVLSLKYLEAPVRSRRLFAGAHRWVAPAASMALIVAMTTALIYSHADVESMISQDFADPRPSEWLAQDEHRKLRMVVVGNSIAKNLVRGLRDWGRANGVAVFDRAKNACGAASGGEYRTARGVENELADHRCTIWRAKWPSIVRDIEPDIVVVAPGGFDIVERRLPGADGFVAAGQPDHDDWLVGELVDVIDVFAARGASVVLLNSPCLQVSDEARRLPAIELKAVLHLNNHVLPRVAALRPERSSIVDLFAHACPDGEFTHNLGGMDKARADGIHFQAPEAKWIGERIGPEIIAAAAR